MSLYKLFFLISFSTLLLLISPNPSSCVEASERQETDLNPQLLDLLDAADGRLDFKNIRHPDTDEVIVIQYKPRGFRQRPNYILWWKDGVCFLKYSTTLARHVDYPYRKWVSSDNPDISLIEMHLETQGVHRVQIARFKSRTHGGLMDILNDLSDNQHPYPKVCNPKYLFECHRAPANAITNLDTINFKKTVYKSFAASIALTYIATVLVLRIFSIPSASEPVPYFLFTAGILGSVSAVMGFQISHLVDSYHPLTKSQLKLLMPGASLTSCSAILGLVWAFDKFY